MSFLATDNCQNYEFMFFISYDIIVRKAILRRILLLTLQPHYITKTVMFAHFFFRYDRQSGFELKRAAADLTSGSLGA